MSIKEFGLKDMVIMPPAPDLCQECAAKHGPGDPHNKDSLYYQMKFHQKLGRHPKWADAMAHCDEDTKDEWIQALARLGIQVYGPDGCPI